MQKNHFLILIIFLSSCASSKNNFIESSWLMGTWSETSDEIKIIQTWSNLNDSTVIFKSFIFENTDTVSKEFARIEYRNGIKSYYGFFNNSAKNKPAVFKLSVSSKDSLVFENPNYEFPQKITYRKISKNILESEISGNNDGEFIIEKFQLKRIK